MRADATRTLAYPKTGLLALGAEDYVGKLHLADIGVPPSLIAAEPLGLRPEIVSAESEVLRVDRWAGLVEPALSAAMEARVLAEAAETTRPDAVESDCPRDHTHLLLQPFST